MVKRSEKTNTVNQEMEHLSLMFVCAGNTCRSPMAEYIFQHMCKEEGLNTYIFSRGMNIIEGMNALPEAVDSVARYNPDIDMRSHIANRISKEDIVKADVILTMEEMHNVFVDQKISQYHIPKKQHPQVYTLKEYAHLNEENYTDLDIEDPLGHHVPIGTDYIDPEITMEQYDATRDEIIEQLELILYH